MFSKCNTMSIFRFIKKFLQVLLIICLIHSQNSLGQNHNPLCGMVFVDCTNFEQSPYRTVDGSCNNIKNPGLGTVNSTYLRIVKSNYADGVKEARNENNTPGLLTARQLSYLLSPDKDEIDHRYTIAGTMYGQTVSHDMGFLLVKTPEPDCCTKDHQSLDGKLDFLCIPLIIKPDDPVYGRYNVTCQHLSRTVTDSYLHCSNPDKPAEQIDHVTAFIDASFLYGSTNDTLKPLRTYRNGQMKIQVKNGKVFPPYIGDADPAFCPKRTIKEECFNSGDLRINQNPHLAVIVTIFLREHNRIANGLRKLNRHWDDERIFQETRRIVIAIHQHITYYEWLPTVLGKDHLLEKKIIYENIDGYTDDYDENTDPSTINSFVTAALRKYHSQLMGHLSLFNSFGGCKGQLRLSDWIDRPVIVEKDNKFDQLIHGLAFQNHKISDHYFTSEVTQHLHKYMEMYEPIGTDLRATTIQRDRDHGLGRYNDFREFCGLKKAKTFEEFAPEISSENIKRLKAVYPSPDDVEISTGGLLEKNVPGTQMGPTYHCIELLQFYRSRVGDRYFYENKNSPGRFTLDQLKEIRKISLAKLFCNNGDDINYMTKHVFHYPSLTNFIYPCNRIEGIDLSYWKEKNH